MRNHRKGRHLLKAMLIAGLGLLCSSANAQTITTFAGSGTSGYSGDGGPATVATFQLPQAVTTDAAGNVYVADQTNHVVRKISTTGIVTTIAGNYTLGSGFSGDGGPATDAQISDATGVAVDAAGNVYFSDHNNQVIRKVDLAGNISTFAGNYILGAGYSGNGGAATAAQIYNPTGIVVDATGNVYFAEASNSVIRMVDPSGIISTYAGTGTPGYTGDGDPATAATFSDPEALAIDAQGNIYVAEFGNFVIRKIAAGGGSVSTVAGNNTNGNAIGSVPATAAAIGSPYSVAVDRSGNIYIADANNAIVRRVNNGGIMATFAGNGTHGNSGDGPATDASINTVGITTDNSGNVYMGDFSNHVIRLIANQAPVFVNGSTQTFNICHGTSALTSLLTIDDPDAGQTETWTIVTPPSHGAIITGATATSGMGVAPTGFTYQPDGSYNGPDMFVIMVDDGNGGTALTTVNVTVNPSPSITLGTINGICFGSPTASVPYSDELETPTSYSVVWDAPAAAAGFTDAADVPLAGSPLSLSMSTTAAPDVYTGTIRVKNGNGCISTGNTFSVEVFALPVLTTNVTPTQICNNTTFSYVQGGTDVATFMWGRVAVPHITNAAANGTGNISEALSNDTAIQVEVNYADTLVSIHGCMSIYNLTVTINPTPVLYPTPLIGTLCDGSTFGFTSTSQTPTTTFSWSREAYTGNPAASGTGPSISETLNNPTTSPMVVTYVDTLKAYGCTNTQTVQAIVNPTPHLTSTHTPHSVCDSALFRYLDTTQTAGVTSFAWSRGPITGIANSANSGTDSIKEYLDNTTNSPIAVTYVYTLNTNGGCTNSETVTVFVNPTAKLSNPSLTLPSVCDSAAIHFIPASNALGSTIAWTRPFIAGISATAGSGGAGDINEHLHNTTIDPVVVTYVYTTTIDGCAHTDNVKVTVNPKPQITNLSTIKSTICDNTPFSFSPLGTTGTFNWSRPYVSGIGAIEQTGTGSINETLKNNTNVDVPVTYIYTVTVSGCTATQSFTFAVHPTPTLRVQSTPLITCSGASYSYKLESLTPNVAFQWTYTPVANLTATPSTGTGTGTATINTRFVNISSSPQVARLAVGLTIGTDPVCSYHDTVKVTVESIPTPTAISVKPAGTICAGAMYQNFGAAVAPGTGSSYTWSATNATVWATGNTGQYAVINFTQPGTSIITLSATNSNGCDAAISDTVTVGGGSVNQPYIIYTSSHFVCLQNDVKSFQWGYDDAATLDSTAIPGAIDQSYFIQSPDLIHKHYWVMTSNDGCTKKSYFNAPTGVTDLNTANEMRVFPNPATNTLNVEMNTTMPGSIRVEVANMLGQKMNIIETNEHKTAINVADLAAGYYIVDCFIGDLKIGTAKFIKN